MILTEFLLFWYYLPIGKHYLLNNEVIAQVDIEISKVDIPKAALEDIPYNRAWIVWSRTPGLRLVGRHVNLRMEGYVKDCQFMGKIENFYNWPSRVYLCEKLRINNLDTSSLSHSR